VIIDREELVMKAASDGRRVKRKSVTAKIAVQKRTSIKCVPVKSVVYIN